MKVKPIDIFNLHLNVNRKEGNELTDFNSALRDNSSVLNSIEKLIEAELLKKENSIEISLPRMLKPELEEIIKKAGLKKTGNKPVLAERIIENIDYIRSLNIDIDLPTIYAPTEKGVKLIEETDYIKHFGGTGAINLLRAQKIIGESKENNIDDKIEYIYLFEINRLYKEKPLAKIRHDIDNHIGYFFSEIAKYFRHKKYNYDKARKYYNLAYYVCNIFYNQERLKDSHGYYYDFEGNFKEEQAKSKLTSSVYGMSEIYEQLIYIDNLSNDEIFNLFLDDVKDYYTPDEEFCRYFFDGFMAEVKKESVDEVYLEFKKMIDTEYPYEKPDYVSSYKNSVYDTTFKTSLKTLLEHDVDISVEIDKETGEVHMYLEGNERERILNSEHIEDLTEAVELSEEG